MLKKLLLIDGHNLLFRMFYGMPEIRDHSGACVQAVVGFVHAVARTLSMLKPTHVLILFDSEDCGDRRQLCPEYKANRPDFSEVSEDECPFSQLPKIYKALAEMKIPYAEIHGCEADDVIAAYAVNCGKEDWSVLIMSTDRDYYQLISENVAVFQYKNYDSTVITAQTVREKFHIAPDVFADFKCLVGDSSDNIAGVPGIGPKRAAELLNRFGSLQGIIEHAAEIENPKIRSALIENIPLLERNLQLIILDGSAEMPYPPENLLLFSRSHNPHLVLTEIGIYN